MDDMEKRLVSCFSAVLPELTTEEISQASAATAASWDSVATVTLVAVVEEEFGIGIEIEDPAQFQGILHYLRKGDRGKQVAEDLV